MLKKDIADIKKQFKRDNDLLHVQNILNVYIMKDSKEVYHKVNRPFNILSVDEQELFFMNFKKTLTGQLDEKLFALRFQQDVEDAPQLKLNEALMTTDDDVFNDHMLYFVDRLLQTQDFDHDLVITFIKGDYLKRQQSNEDEQTRQRELAYDHQFIMCTMNKTKPAPKDLLFDYVEKTFKYKINVDPIIDLKAPIGGFLFPCFTDQQADVNHILYAAKKANEPDVSFINDVLGAQESTTQKEDKIIFEEIVRDTVGYKIDTQSLSSLYEDIHKQVEEHVEASGEDKTLDYRDIAELLTANGQGPIEPERVKTAFSTVVDDAHFELKAKNIVPKFKAKSIHIHTKVADVKVSPEDLRYVKQMHLLGKRYLMIEVDEETIVDGFTMIPEVFNKQEKNDA